MKGPKFLAEAGAEYEDAVVYYERLATGLGARLVLELEDVIALAMEFPQAAQFVDAAPVQLELRQRILPTFGIKMIYTVRDDLFLIVAIFHGSRRPDYWLDRIQRFH